MSGTDPQEQIVRSIIRMMLENAVTQHQKFGGSLQRYLFDYVSDLLRSGAGAERIVSEASRISAHLHAEVADVVDEILYGPKRKLQSAVHESEGVNLEDPRQVIAYTDASCYPNPGPGACAAILYSEDGKELARRRKPLDKVTSNEAEYHGAILALETALELGYDRMELRSDSELLVRQCNGEYSLRSGNLVPLYERLRQLVRQFRYVRFVHVPREQNVEAHQLVSGSGPS